jgi:SAM-dependent MidA family methyltransferase
MPFTRFMELALYEPQHGYYARRHTQVGKDGDFFTSVSVGSVFGQLLAAHILEWRRSTQPTGKWRIIELGAHAGQLASDILSSIDDPELEYTIIEPLPHLAETQRKNLAAHQGRLNIVSTPDSLADPAVPTYLLANEVLDALPFHVIEADASGQWIELGVGLDQSVAFAWHPLGPAPDALIAGIPTRPAGYRTEVRPSHQDFLAPLLAAIPTGRMLWLDYGYLTEDYYHPSRKTGTIRTYRNHQAGEDPLIAIGEQDITAHVDFSRVVQELESLGGRIITFENQARFLTKAGRSWLLSLEGRVDPQTMKDLRQFQTLTHPGQLGSKFHCLECSFGE